MRSDWPVRVGVIGAGVMGERHARIYAQLSGCTLVGVYDPDQARAAQVASDTRCGAYASLEALLDQVSAVSVVSPTVTHAAIASRAIDHGVHLLIEKPMTASLDEAEALARQAGTSDVVILVGHVERFNPVVRELRRVIAARSVRHVTMRRISQFSSRCLDTDVISDLMIHDIDLVRGLFGTRMRSISARGLRVRSSGIDQAIAELALDGGPSVTLIASRVSDTRVREIEVTLDGACVTADLLASTITTTTNADPSGRCTVRSHPVPRVEPLRAELQHFLDCVAGQARPLIDASSGLQAVSWAASIRALIDQHNASALALSGAGAIAQ